LSSSSETFDVVAVGSLVWERTVLLGALPPDGSRPIAEVFDGGGSAANTLVVAAGLGLRCLFVGTGGDDDEGRAARDALLRAGVEVMVRLLPGRRTKCNTVFVEAGTGRTTFLAFVPEKVAPPVRPEDAPLPLLRRARVMHMDRVSMTNLALAKGGGVTSLDLGAAPFRPAQRARLLDLLPMLSLLKVSEPSAKLLPKEAPVPWCVVTRDGGQMTLLERGRLVSNMQPEPVRGLVDPTGAGDAFAAGLIYGWIAGLTFEAACTFATRLAAQACLALGARGAWTGVRS